VHCCIGYSCGAITYHDIINHEIELHYLNKWYIASSDVIGSKRDASECIVSDSNIIVKKILASNSGVSSIPSLVICLRQVDNKIENGDDDGKHHK
jgi:hypothetical protein